MDEIGPERRGLEQIVLEVTTAERGPGGGDRMIRVELVKLRPPPPHLDHDRAAVRAADRGGRVRRRPPPRPGPGHGPAFLSAVLNDGALYPAAAMAMVVPVFLPIAVAVLAGDSVAGEAAGGTLRYLLIRPVGRTRLLVAKLVSVTAFVLMAVVAVVATSFVDRRRPVRTGHAGRGG